MKKVLSILDSLPAPDVWSEVEVRRPRSEPPQPPHGRSTFVPTLVAFAVAAAGFALAVRGFYGERAGEVRGQLVDQRPIVFALIDDATNDSNIYSVNADGSGLKQLTNYSGTDHSPAWSPDSSRVAFVSDREDQGNNDIYVMDADGSNVTRITHSPHIDGGPAWSPDGKRIAFWRSSPDGTWIPFLVDVQGGTPYSLPGGMNGDSEFDWSPDGKQIALTRNSGGDVGVYVIDPETGEVLRRFDDSGGQASPSWGPQGASLVFVSGRNGLTVANSGTGLTRTIKETSGNVVSPEWSSQGDAIAYETFAYDSMQPEGAKGDLHVLDVGTGNDITIPLPAGQRLLWGLSW